MQSCPLSRALFLNDSPTLVAFTGSGGKTTCSEALAVEAAARGRRVVVTTTTKIRVPPSHVDPREPGEVAEALARGVGPLYVGVVAPDGKKMCAPPMPLLEALPTVADLVVVEADGSRGASLKAYREGEPVLPAHVDRLCVLLGVDVVGADRTSALVHREHLLWPLLGHADDAPLTAADVIRAMRVQPSYLGMADRMPTCILLNKVDDRAAMDRAASLLEALTPHLDALGVVRVLRRGRAVEGGVDVAWQRAPRRQVAAILLGAGGSTRYGSRKQTAEVGDRPLLAAALAPLLRDGVASVTVVLGHDHQVVEAAIRETVDDPRVRYVVNPAWPRGMATSIAAGVAASPRADGFLIALGDMPFISPATIDALLETFASSPFDIVAPTHGGRRGHPVVFAARYEQALRALHGDVGASPLLRRHAADMWLLEVADAGIHRDVDHPSALETP